MKFQLYSDVHLEFGYLNPQKHPDADVLVLAGDIITARSFYDHGNVGHKGMRFFKKVSQLFKHVIYVAGNHEHYHGKFEKTHGLLRQALRQFDNIHILDGESVEIDDVLFVGTTLFTNYRNGNPDAMHMAEVRMNDYRFIETVVPPTSPYTTSVKINSDFLLSRHIQELAKLCELADNHGKVAVVTHHAPTYKSLDTKYLSTGLDSCYASALENIILDRPQIKCWVHGHVHKTNNYEVGGCTVHSNPAGYPINTKGGRENSAFDRTYVVEIT